MAIEVQGTPVSTQINTKATSQDVNLPTGIESGELLIISVLSGEPNAWSATDWTWIDGGGLDPTTGKKGFLYKVAEGDEGATVTVTIAGAGGQVSAIAARLSGVDTTDPTHADNAAWGSNGSAATNWNIASGVLTGLSNGSGLVVFICREVGAFNVDTLDSDLVELGENTTSTPGSSQHSLHATVTGSSNPQYDYVLSASMNCDWGMLEIKAAAEVTVVLPDYSDHRVRVTRTKPWTKAPSHESADLELDWSNPLTKDLVFAFIAPSRKDLVSGTQELRTSHSEKVRLTPLGKLGFGYHTGDNTGYKELTWKRTPKTANNISGLITVIWIGHKMGSTGTNPGFMARRIGWTQGAWSLYDRSGGGLSFAGNDGATRTVHYVSGAVPNGHTCLAHVSKTTTDHKGYWRFANAKTTSTDTIATRGDFDNSNNHSMVVGGIQVGYSQDIQYGVQYTALVYNRALSDAEIEQIFDNPFRLLKPQRVFTFDKRVERIISVPSGPRTSQPPPGTGVNESNSLTKGLTFLWNAKGIASEYADGSISTDGVATPRQKLVPSPDVTPVIGVEFHQAWRKHRHGNLEGFRPVDGGAGDNDWIDIVATGPNSFDTKGYDYTLLQLRQFHTTDEDHGIFGLNSDINWFIFADTLSSNLRSAAWDGGGSSQFAGTNNLNDTDRIYPIVVRYDDSEASNNLEVWVDGSKGLTHTDFSPTSNPYDNIRINGHAGGSGKTGDSTVYLVGIWNRKLSDSEIRAVSKNPWQLFERKGIHAPIAKIEHRLKQFNLPRRIG